MFHYCDSFLSPSAAAQAEGVPAYIAEHGVVEAYDLGDLSERYLLAVYWGFQSLTNLGYSDLIPDNAIEMVFAWFLCVFQVSFYAYILGTLFSFVVRKDGNAESYRKSIAALESYSRNRNLPKKLHDSLIRYFDFQLSKSDNDDNTQVVNSLPNTLLAKVADFKYSSIVLKAACFTTIPSEFLTSVLERLRPRFLMPNERLFNQGDMSRELCFVEKGTLLVYADNDEKIFVREVNNDTAETPMVGEYSFFLTVAQPEMVKTVSNGDVTVLVLSKEDYLSCLENYPESQSIISSRLLAELGLNSKGDEVRATINVAGTLYYLLSVDSNQLKPTTHFFPLRRLPTPPRKKATTNSAGRKKCRQRQQQHRRFHQAPAADTEEPLRGSALRDDRRRLRR